jgi:hypothetical protein
MTMYDTTSTERSTGGLLPLRPHRDPEERTRQVDIGDYTIFTGGIQVGEVYVEAAPGHPDDPAHTVEHWCLYAAYQAPGPDRDVTLELRYRGEYESLNAFLQHVVTLRDVRYICAVCDQSSPADALRSTQA